MSVTIHDIARHTGFNASTVSRALRYDSRISRDTMEKILEAAERLGYVRNFAASNLASGRTKCIVLIMDAVSGTMQTLPAAALNQVLINAGYTLMILLHNNEKLATENCISKLEERICDAAVMIPPPIKFFDEHLTKRIKKLPIPLFFIDRWLEDTDGAVVTTDVEKSMRLLMQHVMSEKLDAAFIVRSEPNSVGLARFYWCSKILEENGIPWTADVKDLRGLIKKHRVKTLGVLADSPWLTCHIKECLKDNLPERFIGGMFDNWVNVPPDFYDRIYLCLQDFSEIGRQCANLVLDILRGYSSDKRITEIPPEGVTVINCSR